MQLINSLKQSYNEIVLMINDTRLHSNIEFSLPGYSLIRTDKNSGDSTSGGSAIAIPDNWDVEIVPSITEAGNGFEATGIIVIPTGSAPLKLLSIYNHPQTYVPQHLLAEFVNVKLNNKVLKGIIGGDFNCSHEAFSSRFTNFYGTSLLTLVNNLNLLVMDNTEPTHYHRGEPNILDLFIYEPRSHDLIQECYVGESIGSDHLPLILHVTVNSSCNGQPQKTKVIFDSSSFKEEMESRFLEFDSACDSKTEVDKKLRLLTQTLQEIKEKYTTEKPWRHKRMNLPPEILAWIQTRKKLLKEMKKAQTTQEKRAFSHLYNKANLIVKDLLEEFDNQKTEEAIQEMQQEKDSSKMWKWFQSLKQGLQPNNAIKRPLKSENGECITKPEDKATIFADRLEKIHQTPRHPSFDQQFENNVNAFVQEHEDLFTEREYPGSDPDNSHPMLNSFTTENFKQKLTEAKKKSAPGDDGISYQLLRGCPDIFFLKLLQILNFCLLIGYFPQQWKDAKVIMLQKPGKDHTDPKGYRPISLLPAIGKIFERLICDRLVGYLEEKDIINRYQAGYRKGRSTQEHILRLSQQVFNGFKQQECTLAVFLDCEAAFDAVWTKGLMYKMYQLNLPSNFLRLLCSFLSNRSLSVHVEGYKSRPISLRAGTPQGSCLSPILFSIHVNDIPFTDMVGCQPSQYADDTGLWSTGKDTITTANNIQRALNCMENWCKKWRVKLCPSKTNVVLFTKCHKAHMIKPQLFLFGEELTYTNEAVFLGVKFNSSLTWEPQIRALIAKAQPRLNLIKALVSSCGHNNNELLLRLYMAIVRPIFEYSSIAHVNAAACHHRKLQQIQNTAIRVILKIPNYIHTDILHDASGLPMLHEHITAFGKKRLTSMLKKSPLIQEVVDQFMDISHLKIWKSPLEYLL